MKKRLFCLLLAVCLLAPLFPTGARAAGEDLHSYTPLMLAKRRFESMGLEPDASREYLAMLEEVFEPGVHAAGESEGAK